MPMRQICSPKIVSPVCWRSLGHVKVHCRSFTHGPRQCLVNRPVSRPQAPYLSQTPYISKLSPVDRQLLRVLSTDRRRHVKYIAWRTVKWGALVWLGLYIANTTLFEYNTSRMEAEYPTPKEWSWAARQGSRLAKRAIDTGTAAGNVNWVSVGNGFNITLRRLESGAVDGEDVVVQEAEDGGPIVIAEVGAIGPDVTHKSWAWRQGYCDCIMGLAKASENTEDLVRDTTRDLAFPRDVMVGPSNPDPRPVTSKMPPAPREEDCQPVFPPPETYYMRILTGRGFTTLQKLDAAWAYANWLEFSGSNSAAEEMYRWAVDIAREARPEHKECLDPKTLVIRAATPKSYTAPSSNLLRAVSLFGVHRARTGDPASALAILLSVLRARQAAPRDASPPPAKELPRPATTDVEAFTNFFSRLFAHSPSPVEPPSGDDSFIQSAGMSDCEDGQIMLYLGEIMFATVPEEQDGILWTRKAVDVIESAIYAAGDLRSPTHGHDPALIKCKKCLKIGFDNWNDMLSIQAARDQSNAGRAVQRIRAVLDADLERLAQLQRVVAKDQSELDLMLARKAAPYRIFSTG